MSTRISKAGVFEAFFDMLAAMSPSAHVIQMLDSTIVRAHVWAAGAKGEQKGHALSRSKGRFTTKIHGNADGSGALITFDLTGGEAADCTHFETQLDIGSGIKPRRCIEHGVGKLKRFTRVALRYEKPLTTFDQSSVLPLVYA